MDVCLLKERTATWGRPRCGSNARASQVAGNKERLSRNDLRRTWAENAVCAVLGAEGGVWDQDSAGRGQEDGEQAESRARLALRRARAVAFLLRPRHSSTNSHRPQAPVHTILHCSHNDHRTENQGVPAAALLHNCSDRAAFPRKLKMRW